VVVEASWRLTPSLAERNPPGAPKQATALRAANINAPPAKRTWSGRQDS
jgi:hypothetical protein